MLEKGRICFVGEVTSGVSTRTGEVWKSVEFAIDTIHERYPRKVAFTLFGEEKIKNAALLVGMDIDVYFYPVSHSYNGNWYTELRVTDIQQGQRSILVAPLI